MKLNNFYRNFLCCTFTGALGEYMALTTLSWYLLETYHNLSVIGTVLSFRIIPRFFMGFIGGYLADMHKKKRMMILIYFFIMITSLVQTIMITMSNQPAWYLLGSVLLVRSIFDGAEPSVRNAILPHIADRSMIAKAVGYYSTGLNMAAIVAPILAAFLMQHFSFATVFWIDWSFQIPSFIILFKIPKIKEIKNSNIKKSFVHSYKEALRYIYNSKVLFRCLITSILMMLVMFPFGAMLSIYVKNVLLLDIKNFGYISAIEALGAVLAGIILHKVFNNESKKFSNWYAFGFLSGICLIALSIKPNMVFIYLIIFLLGLSSQLFRSFSRILFQQHTPDHLRGKVMSIIISDSSVISLGLLIFTFFAEVTSVSESFLVMGLCSSVMIILIFIVDKMVSQRQNEILK